MIETFKLLSGKYLIPVTAEHKGESIFLRFKYDKVLKDEIKNMAGSRWNPDTKCWAIHNNNRNLFQLRYLRSRTDVNIIDPYQVYDQPPESLELKPRFNRSHNKEILPFQHQIESTGFVINRPGSILAEEMGLGKTLAIIMAMEILHDRYGWRDDQIWYVAPSGVIRAIERELIIWNSRVRPILMTYERMVAMMKTWDSRNKAPAMVIFDESQKIKNAGTQRSQAAISLADGVRGDWGYQARVVLMTGTPAPRAPDDWYAQCETAQPGYLKEGDIFKFRRRLGVYVKMESAIGGFFPKLVCWRDDPSKCSVCGEIKQHPNHMEAGSIFGGNEYHEFESGLNEIDNLYRRMHGLVMVRFKKDCLDLPEKRYSIVELKPDPSTERAARMAVKSAATTIEGLTRLREISDGFLYQEKESGVATCPLCSGTSEAEDFQEVPESCPNCKGKNLDDPINQCSDHKPKIIKVRIKCPNCVEGRVKTYSRHIIEVACPKDDALDDDLAASEEVGRIVLFGGFTATLDRIIRRCHLRGWATIRVDQGKWVGKTEADLPMPDTDYLSVFQDWKEKYPKVAFVANPNSGGLGTTLTASPLVIFYSNDFNGGSRTQSEDRPHRPGMDLERGLMIKDYIHLPSDLKVRDNLLAKRRLELMSLGDIETWLNKDRVD